MLTDVFWCIQEAPLVPQPRGEVPGVEEELQELKDRVEVDPT